MSKIDFHSHVIDIDGTSCQVSVPGPAYDCDDEQCAFERKVIEGMAEWPQDQLERQIAYQDGLSARHLANAWRLRQALEIKQSKAT
ncbi:hypothetical protein DQP57_00280 [Mycobacterium colombiense]|uniref:Uncharacterized protein n=1 Tax=Mycobacterium colombiense TaxID=339268 RepID=A0A329MCT6_9MYCO|nr:hypothetical protein [Mycobacterium colombiense]RAV17498.1 hypothetical protein DQP57_00280 [Mycobacterium colombiense]